MKSISKIATIVMVLLFPATMQAKPCRVQRISQLEQNVWIQCEANIYKFPKSQFRKLPRVGQWFSLNSVLEVQRRIQKEKGCDEIESRRPVPDKSKP